MKKNKLLKCLCFGLLALLVGVFALIPKSSMKSAGAYVSVPNTPSEFGSNAPGYWTESHLLYSNFLEYEVSRSADYFNFFIYPSLVTTNISNDLSLVAINPSNDFDVSSYLNNYLNFYNDIALQDKTKSIYLQLTVALPENPVYPSHYAISNLKMNVEYVYSDGTGRSISKDYIGGTGSSSNNKLFFAYNGDILLNLSWLANEEFGFTDFATFLRNTEIVIDGDFDSTGYYTDGFFLNRQDFALSFESINSARIYSHHYFTINTPAMNNTIYVPMGSNLADWGNFYYFTNVSSADYYDSFYKQLYNNQLQDKVDTSYEQGYNEGYSKGLDKGSELPSTVIAFASLPFSILGGFLDFDLFGFNIYNVILALVTVFLCIWIIKKIK